MSRFSREAEARPKGATGRARGEVPAARRSPALGNQQKQSAREREAPRTPSPQARPPAAPASLQAPAHPADIAALGRAAAPAAVRDALRGPARALDAATLAYMEPRFGQDLSGVRVHTGAAAQAGAAALSARAFTSGENIVLGTEYAPQTAPGRHLLAHELAHVLQQRGGARPANAMSVPGDAFEREADSAADRVASGHAAGIARPPPGASTSAREPSLMRQMAPRPNPAEYQFVDIEKGGTWDAPAILENISQREYTETRIPLSQRGAGEESDPYRCGSNAVLASAIVGGPKAVIGLCKNLYQRIKQWRDLAIQDDADYQQKRHAARRAGTDPDAVKKQIPYAEVCDRALRKVFDIHWSLDMGVRFGTHQGGGSVLTYADFDRLASYLYIFTLDPRSEWRSDVDQGMAVASPADLKPAVRSRLEPQFEQARKAREDERKENPELPALSWRRFIANMSVRTYFRSESEIADAAALAGYASQATRINSTEVREQWVLDFHLGRLHPGDSLIGLWGPHSYTFFRNHDGKIYLADSWRGVASGDGEPTQYETANGVHEQGSKEYKERIANGLTGADKPIKLLLGAAHPSIFGP